MQSLCEQVVVLVGQQAAQIDGISVAYVSLDGKAFLMCGNEISARIAKLVAEAMLLIQKEVAPSFEPLIEGRYTTETLPVAGWVVAFVRR